MRILKDTYPNVDSLFKWLRSQGYTGNLNDMMFQYLGDQGYFGALSDRMKSFENGGMVSNGGFSSGFSSGFNI